MVTQPMVQCKTELTDGDPRRRFQVRLPSKQAQILPKSLKFGRAGQKTRVKFDEVGKATEAGKVSSSNTTPGENKSGTKRNVNATNETQQVRERTKRPLVHGEETDAVEGEGEGSDEDMAEEDEVPKPEDDLGNTENIAEEERESWNPGDTVVAPQLDDPLQSAVIRLKDKTGLGWSGEVLTDKTVVIRGPIVDSRGENLFVET